MDGLFGSLKPAGGEDRRDPAPPTGAGKWRTRQPSPHEVKATCNRIAEQIKDFPDLTVGWPGTAGHITRNVLSGEPVADLFYSRWFHRLHDYTTQQGSPLILRR
jgi:hypothetical protein